MPDTMLTSANQKEAFSFVYLRAVAARAGYATGVRDYDSDGVDATVQAGGSMRPQIDVQLKATTRLREVSNDSWAFDLPKRNYDLLRLPVIVPRLLVVLDLPKDIDQVLTIGHNELILRRCAYWISLLGYPERSNRRSVTVHLPRTNRFDHSALHQLMDKVRSESQL